MVDETKINRELITAFGEKLLSNKEVKCVSINIDFEDGSKISFHKYGGYY